MHHENHISRITNKYPYSFHLISRFIGDFDRLSSQPIDQMITDGIGLTSTRKTLLEERQHFGDYQIFIHTKSKDDMDSLMALI